MTISLRVLTALLCLLLTAGCGGEAPERDARVFSDGEKVMVSLDHVDSKGGEFFTYHTASGRKVDFFLYRESSGDYHAALDACRKCYRWRKGYRMGEGIVVCRKCGETFDVDSLREGRGSCVPIPLTSLTEGDALVIPLSELEAGAQFF